MQALDSIDHDSFHDIYEDQLNELFKVYEHKETEYRIAFPYANDTPEARSLRRLKRRIKNAAIHLNYNRFITFSYRDEDLPAKTKDISKTMNRMGTYYRKMKKGPKKLFPYFYRLEFGEKKGRPHWHALVRTDFIPEKRMDKWWPHGWHKIRKVNDPAVAIGYISKYMSKPDVNFAGHDVSGLKRRWGCASKITPPTPPPDYKLVVIAAKHYLEEEVTLHNDAIDQRKLSDLDRCRSIDVQVPLIDRRTSNNKVFIIRR